MIDSIAVKNYKAFKEAKLEFKPITILLGANSVGKSSLLQLLLLLKQTATFGVTNDKVPLKMYGPFTNMGSIDNLFHNKNSKAVLEIAVSFRSEKLLRELNVLLDEYVRFVNSIPFFFPINKMLAIRKEISQNTSKSGREVINRTTFEKRIKQIMQVLKAEAIKDFKETLGYIAKNQADIAPSDIFNNSVDAFMTTFDFLSSFQVPVGKMDQTINTVSISLCHTPKEKRLKVCGMKVSMGDKVLFDISSLESFKVDSPSCKVQDSDSTYVKQRLNPYTNIFDIFNSTKPNDEQSTTTANYLIAIANKYLRYLKSEFNPSLIQHIKPLRANPQRYYVIDDEKLTPYASTLDGDRLIEILRDNQAVKDKVNEWLIKYNLSIKIEQSEDVIHHIKIVQDNVELDIPDVGFGISQILPILVQAYCSPKNTITIIEQPEIHLHPILQADVADLLRQSASIEKPIIVETHSEYFLRRIRRRVATKEMSSNDVSINLLSGKTKDRDYTEMKRLDMTETGTFEWPSDYYDGELYHDVIDFIAAQSQSQSQSESE